jgi:hypothetical protein
LPLTVTTPARKRGMLEIARHGGPAKPGVIMTTKIKYIAPWFAAVAIGSAIALAPAASASVSATTFAQSNVVAHSAPTPTPAQMPADSGPDPLVPYGTEPTVPYRLGYINPNHDEGNTTNGEVDVPF